MKVNQDTIKLGETNVELMAKLKASHQNNLALWQAIAGGPEPHCRDCADCNGRCQNVGLPCDPQERALERVAQLRAQVERALRGFRAIYGVTPHPDTARIAAEAIRSLSRLCQIPAECERERDEARQLVIEANNSLYGSHGYFHSLNGGPFDKHHLSRGIEKLKADNSLLYALVEELKERVHHAEGTAD
jgi:hypothetical protein